MTRAPWLDRSELRVGLGCMRLPTHPHGPEEVAVETIAAAAAAGVTVFDTARAYGPSPRDFGHNERLLARALRSARADGRARVVTKGGMTRAGERWIPDGRARSILGDCEASLEALDGLPIDVYLVHAPDPRTPWRTTLRALGRLLDEGLVRGVGVANVNRPLLDEALEHVELTAVQVALSPFDDRALRAGVVDRCADNGIALIAHSPLGGPRRANGLGRRQALREVAVAHEATPAEVALAWLLALSPAVVAVPGARRPESASSAARAARLALAADERAAISRDFNVRNLVRGVNQVPDVPDADVVLVMGIPGAGKSRLAREYADRGYVRLNRDQRAGPLRALAAALDERLAGGARRVVLDNTYLTRAARSHVVDAAAGHDVRVRCVWLDTPLAQAQVNLVERLLELHGALPPPDELRAAARRAPGLLMPTSQMRALRELEPPSLEEGFAAVERVPFVRASRPGSTRAGVFVAAAAVRRAGWRCALAEGAPDAPHLVFDWNPDGGRAGVAAAVAAVEAEVGGQVEGAVCAHPGGPPACWCRPPLPGLPLAFARAHGVDPSRSLLVGTGPAHRTLAGALGARYIAVPE